MNTNQHQKFKKPKQTTKQKQIKDSQKSLLKKLDNKQLDLDQYLYMFNKNYINNIINVNKNYQTLKISYSFLDLSKYLENKIKSDRKYDGKEFVGWLVFPPDYPASWPVFCLCYPKNNNMDRTNDRDKLAFQHENVYQSGEMSIPAFEKDGWELIGPKLLHNFFQIIACIIGHPNPFSPANQKLVENSEESQKLLIQYQLQYLNDYPSKKQ